MDPFPLNSTGFVNLLASQSSPPIDVDSVALKEQASGHSENDVMKAAHDIFFNDYKEKRQEADAEVVPEEEEVRPPGVKASKAAKRKKPNEAAFDQIHSILAQKIPFLDKRYLIAS
ncbi:hypothetical protein F2Q70_00035144 [Brassica cretica]|uniref:Uncharacterized protein n=1 Tax=Brassica cretica TaxID=69181 RepID=A0A8S9GBA7_BRACR|nr:hypothetical protein F2Q68_00030219 [Brassica cretica]KAF2587077.1 hypothetical protein F2Q70_00035144 [Brassica cretica]